MVRDDGCLLSEGGSFSPEPLKSRRLCILWHERLWDTTKAGIAMNRAPKVRLEVSPWRASRERGEAMGSHGIRRERQRRGTFCGPFMLCGLKVTRPPDGPIRIRATQ